MYAKQTGEIIKRRHTKYYYLDHTQEYITLKACDKWDDITSSIEDYIVDISTWMKSNMLKLNEDKSEFIVFSSKQHVKKTDDLRIKVGSSYRNSSMYVQNIGDYIA